MDDALVFEPSPDVIAQQVADETVLMDLKTEAYFGLNETGTRIWQLVSDRRTVGEISRSLADLFDAPAPRVREDMETLLAELQESGLIHTAVAAGPRQE